MNERTGVRSLGERTADMLIYSFTSSGEEFWESTKLQKVRSDFSSNICRKHALHYTITEVDNCNLSYTKCARIAIEAARR